MTSGTQTGTQRNTGRGVGVFTQKEEGRRLSVALICH